MRNTVIERTFPKAGNYIVELSFDSKEQAEEWMRRMGTKEGFDGVKPGKLVTNFPEE